MKIKLWCLLALLFFCGLVQAFDLNGLRQQLQQAKTVQGQFIQERYLASLNKPLQTQGQFVLLQKQGLWWNMRKPFVQLLRIRADGIWQKTATGWQKNNATPAMQQKQMQLFMDLFAGNTRNLQRQFDIHLEGAATHWQLSLVPKTTLMKQIFQRIDIKGDEVVRSVDIREKQGERTLMRFMHVQTDQPVSPEIRRAFVN